METIAGVLQVVSQWFLFSIMCVSIVWHCHVYLSPVRSQVLYIVYYPSHLKYATTSMDDHDTRPPSVKTNVKTYDWHLSIVLSWVVSIHLLVFFSCI